MHNAAIEFVAVFPRQPRRKKERERERERGGNDGWELQAEEGRREITGGKLGRTPRSLPRASNDY
jgi:hypothetical protein